MKNFLSKYAEYYDMVYSQEKDYKKECDYIESLIKWHFKCGPQSILDIACGTGKHIIELSGRGFRVAGSDISRDMLRIARKSSAEKGLKINFYNYAMEDLRLPSRFDVIICMFAAFDYLTEEKNIRRALKNIRTHLTPGGLFIMDFWNKKMFEKYSERFRVKDVTKDGLRLIRISDSEILKEKNMLEMKIKCLVLHKNRLTEEFSETHLMRYFDSAEIRKYVVEAGLKPKKIVPFIKVKGNTDKSWILCLTAENRVTK